MKAANTHDVSLKRGGDQPAAFGAAEVVAADVETLNVRCVTYDVSDVGGIVGRDGVVAEVDVGDVDRRAWSSRMPPRSPCPTSCSTLCDHI